MIGSMLLSLLILQLCSRHASVAVRLDHELGRTSMDSTHYDRRLVQQPCPTKNVNLNSLIPLSNALIGIREDNTLVNRASGAIDVNNDHPLGIDEALVNIEVDTQVKLNTNLFALLLCVTCSHVDSKSTARSPCPRSPII